MRLVCNFLKKAAAVSCSCLMVLMAFSTNAFGQAKSLTGTVLDESGIPVVGASVIVKGTTRGVVTSNDGKYFLNSVSPSETIVVSCIGYVEQSRLVGNSAIIDFILEEESELLNELVVVGYGVQKKSDVTASISSVKGDDLLNRPVENIQSALVGKVAGVQVFTSSSAPGSEPSIRVRGLSSNSSGASDPLYVVDGLKVSSIGYLDANMIESIEILKDAASASIYGAEAGNGVVLITTKSGATAKDNGRIFYNFSYGWNSLAKKADLMNAEQYIAYQTAVGNGTAMSAYDGYTDNDWQESLYGDGGSIMKHTFGFEGGNDKGSMYAAMSFMNNDGMYYGDKDKAERISLQLNATRKVKSWLEVTTNNSFSYSTYSPIAQKTAATTNPYLYDPLTPLFYSADNLTDFMSNLISTYGDDMFMKNENGDYVAVPAIILDSSNPLTTYYSEETKYKNFRLRGTTAINFKPIKGLTITSRLGYRYAVSNYRYYAIPVYHSVSSRTVESYTSRVSNEFTYEWENFANYYNSFGKHSIDGMIGMSYRRKWSNYTSGTTDSFTSDASNFRYLSYSSSDATDSVAGVVSETSNVGYFGRIGYSYDDRYGIQVSFRADAYDTSKLSAESRWGYFPSVAGRWTISNEPFMSGVSKRAVSYLKLRVSYGENGNVNVLSDYPYAASLSTGDYYPMDGTNSTTVSITPSDVLENPSLEWEVSKQVDVGIDSRFLSDRLSFTLDWYNKNTTGQLISMTPPMSSGATSVTRNVGKVNNSGFEFELGWRDTAGDFFYSIDANLSTLHNEVKSLGGNSRISGTGMVVFDEGYPVWSYYGYKYLGCDDATGEAVYYDADGDGTITTNDKVHLGSAIPDITYGLTLNFAYKGFDLSIVGSGSAGGQIVFSTGSEAANNLAEVWTESYHVKGAGAKYPSTSPLTDSYMRSSDMQMFSGNYFKIKQIALGYNVPEKILKKAFVSSLRLYISLDNFICFTKYPGMDPESISADSSMGIDQGGYPVPKTFSIGANISF